MLASIVLIGSLVVLAAVGGAVGVVLFLRRNSKIAADVETVISDASKK